MSVFSDVREQARLATQNRLMYECEAPLFRNLFTGSRSLNVLDVGSNNGEKTVRWFSDPAVSHVLGLEYSASLAQRAQETYGGGRFRFCACDAEAKDFDSQLASLMAEESIDGFDIVYLSFVLSHLREPEKLLRHLRRLLRPGGSLVAVETDDAKSILLPHDGRFRDFLDMLASDPYAGDRSLGGRLTHTLSDCGFHDPTLRCTEIAAGSGENEKKEMIFEMFFSYLPDDVALLRQSEPENTLYARWEAWIRENFIPLQQAICAPDSLISMGMSLVICS